MAHLAIHQSSSKQIFARSEKTPLYAGILTYEYQQSVGKIPRGEPICGCDVDGYRPDTLGGEIGAKAHFYPSLLPHLRPTCVSEASPCLHSRKYFDLNKSRQSRNGSY